MARGIVSLPRSLRLLFATHANTTCLGVILCDPPIESIRVDYSLPEQIRVQESIVPCGYLDFMPLQYQLERRSGPSRRSMMADLRFYLTTSPKELDLSPIDTVRLIATKIVASHYVMQADYLREIMNQLELSPERMEDQADIRIADAEEQWTDAQTLGRRMNQYCEYLEANMLQLRVPFREPDTSQVADWTDITADFQYLYLRFKGLRHRAEMINSSITGLTGIVGNRQAIREQQLALGAAERSIREARSAKALTFVGLIFIPLAYTSSLFSMGSPYGPGQDGFWLYFAISIPLIILVVSGYYVLDFGYGADGSSWSFTNLANRMANLEFRRKFKGGLESKRDIEP